VEESAGHVRVDPGQMEQVIVNLVVNARDAMPNGGRLLIETATARVEDEQAASQLGIPPGRYVRLSVEDGGLGMTDEVLSRMYEPFFTTKPAGTGTGLGLSTVYGIVEQAGGAIVVRSAIGAGSRFDVYLPEEAAEVQQPVTVRPAATATSGSEALLVVEDEKAVRDLASKLLSRRGYRVHAVEDGPTALALLQSGEFVPDLLLTDVILPAMNGRIIAENVKELVPGIAVVFMSGYTNEHLGDRGVLADDVAFLEKPFTSAGLLEIIRRQLDARSEAAELALVSSPSGGFAGDTSS
jgi:two-component system cell cycle sensor histidine kinase/response regulator CckA